MPTAWRSRLGLLAAFFAAVLPTVFVAYGIRRGRWEDRNVGDRRPRLVVLGFIIASVATGLILLAVLGAPAVLTGYLAFMLASVAALAAITLVWKISIHCAVAAGSVTILALIYGPLVLGGYALVGLLGIRLEGRCGAGKVSAGWTGSGCRGGATQGWARAAARSLVRPSSLARAIGFM